ncbi:MAG: T9SS type A sorting domain-containing protein [Chlorobi bacterium]|nr:T9SS type A sorting domain-containing protein [Chlorobiota bacterium]
MKNFLLTLSIFFMLYSGSLFSQAIIIDHNCAKLEPVTESAVNQAKQTLHIAYGHTSHGSQLITGMSALIGQTSLNGYKGDIYDWNEGGTDGALDIDDYFGSGDLGHNGDTSWAPYTRTYLADNPDVNVVIYSWCGGLSDNTPDGIQTYLDKMNELEQQYPGVKFVYMTGHADIWADETVKSGNNQIRNYCRTNNKILYDFNDIEMYNPDGTYFEFVNDNCDYYDAPGGNLSGNWAEEWRNTHTEGVDWYDCDPAHTDALNGNLKAYAAWWLWCRLAGWEGTGTEIINAENNFELYPNPVENILKIKTNEKILRIEITDITGKLVKTEGFSGAYNEINVSDLEPGIYFLNMDTEKGQNILNFIKK